MLEVYRIKVWKSNMCVCINDNKLKDKEEETPFNITTERIKYLKI
jgi:hypothetical protein